MTIQEIQPGILPSRYAGKIIFLESVDSTNTYAKQLIQKGVDDGTIVLAEEQTSGKGRLGRSWSSEKGANLTFSIILKPNISVNELGLLSLCSGLAVTEAIHRITDILPDCKWPNDVLIKEKKVCGILSEIVSITCKHYFVIVGIGINVNQSGFSAELLERATSLKMELGKEINKLQLLKIVIEQFERYYSQLLSHKADFIVSSWRQHSTMLGKQISIDQQGNIIHGTALDVNPDGSLLLQSNGKQISVHAGDVTIIKK